MAVPAVATAPRTPRTTDVIASAVLTLELSSAIVETPLTPDAKASPAELIENRS